MVTQQITLTDEQAAFIRQSIESGQFSDESEVLRVALLMLQESEKAELTWLRSEIQKGLDDIEAGRFINLDSEDNYRANREEISNTTANRLS